MKNRATNALIEMGVPANIKGFRYIVDAMCLFEDEEYRDGKTMVLYWEIGKMHGVRAQNVERAIRHAFGIALNKGHLSAIQKYLSFDNTTNGSQLYLLYIRLKQEMEEE